MIPKRFSTGIKEIWQLQHRLGKRYGRRAYQMLEHPKFRAAYDFLLLRGQIEGGNTLELADWWTEFQQQSAEKRKGMLNNLRDKNGTAPKRRRRRSKPRAPANK